MKLPSKTQSYQLIAEMGMLEHIVAHSIQVYRVATVLVDHLAAGNLKLNRGLVQASALLHDITKTQSFSSGENHAQTGARLLHALGYPEVASIVGQHIQLDKPIEEAILGEAEIVNYADKRVLHDRIVTLAQRMEYILQRYGETEKHRRNIRQLWLESEQLEQKIFTRLVFGPEELARMCRRKDAQKEALAYQKACAANLERKIS